MYLNRVLRSEHKNFCLGVLSKTLHDTVIPTTLELVQTIVSVRCAVTCGESSHAEQVEKSFCVVLCSLCGSTKTVNDGCLSSLWQLVLDEQSFDV